MNIIDKLKRTFSPHNIPKEILEKRRVDSLSLEEALHGVLLYCHFPELNIDYHEGRVCYLIEDEGFTSVEEYIRFKERLDIASRLLHEVDTLEMNKSEGNQYTIKSERFTIENTEFVEGALKLWLMTFVGDVIKLPYETLPSKLNNFSNSKVFPFVILYP